MPAMLRSTSASCSAGSASRRCVSANCASLVDAARGMEQDGGLGEERPAQGVVARRQLQRAAAEVGAGPGVGRRERLAGAQEDRDRLLVAGLGARRDLRGNLDGRGAGRQEHVGGLAVERPSGRHRDALTDRLAGDVVAEGEPVAALDEHPAVDQLLHRPEQCRRGPVEHVRQVGEREPAAERGGDRGGLASGRGDTAQALAHRDADAAWAGAPRQLGLTGNDADQVLVPQPRQQLHEHERDCRCAPLTRSRSASSGSASMTSSATWATAASSSGPRTIRSAPLCRDARSR